MIKRFFIKTGNAIDKLGSGNSLKSEMRVIAAVMLFMLLLMAILKSPNPSVDLLLILPIILWFLWRSTKPDIIRIIRVVNLIAIGLFNLIISFLNRDKHPKVVEKVVSIAESLAERELGGRYLLTAIKTGKRSAARRKLIVRGIRVIVAVILIVTLAAALGISPFIVYPISLLIALPIMPDATTIANLVIIGMSNQETSDLINHGKYLEAEQAARAAIDLAELELGENHPVTITRLNNFVARLNAQDCYGEDKPLRRWALKTSERIWGAKHLKILASMENISILDCAQDRHEEEETKPLLQRAMAALNYMPEIEHTCVLTSFSNIADLYHQQGRYEEAKLLYQRVLEIREQILEVKHPDTLTSLGGLATLYHHQGRYGEAEPLYQRALTASERILGPEHPDTLTILGNLAMVYKDQGRYGEAEPLFQRVLVANERVLEAEHPNTLASLDDLASLYAFQNRHGEAEALFQRVLENRERVLGAEHPDTLISLDNLALLYQNQWRYDEAESLFQRALAMSEQVLGSENPHTLTALSNLGMMYEAQGRYGEAEPLLQRALAVSRQMLGENHPDTLISLNNSGLLYSHQGHYGEAELFFQRTLVTRARVLGGEHPDTLTTQLNLIVTYVNNRKIHQALEELRRMDGRLQGFVGAQLDSTLSEKVRRQWLQSKSTFQDVVFTLALAGFVPEETKRDAMALAANVLLRWQRLAGESEALTAHLTRVSEDPKVRELAESIAEARAKWSRQVNLPEPNPKNIAVARAEVEEMEVKLAGLSREFKDQQANRSLEWWRVASALPPGSALLSLRGVHPFDFKAAESGEPRWLALLIPAGAKDESVIILKDLGPAAVVAKQFARLRAADEPREEVERLYTIPADSMKAPVRLRNEESNEAAKKLYALLFGELDEELAKYDSLYLAPDGLLDLAPFARLVLPDGRYWTQRQRLRQIRAGRDMLREGDVDRRMPVSALREPHQQNADRCGSPDGSPHPTDLVAFGDIDYDRFLTAGDWLRYVRGLFHSVPATHRNTAAPLEIPSVALNQHLRKARIEFPPLSATGSEVEDIAKLYEELTNQAAIVYTGLDASEYRLKHLLAPPRVLHLATHGFFWEKETEQTEAHRERPMTLSGLALAGANLGMKGKADSDGEDGILYALEAQNLNLEGTELVVLSACNTGRGEVDVSEGVYGLTRALRTAGARNILMTLWPLHDELAAEFMVDFYRNWLSDHDSRPLSEVEGPLTSPRSTSATPNPMTPATALHKTRLAWIESDDEKKRSPHYWAPYVLVE